MIGLYNVHDRVKLCTKTKPKFEEWRVNKMQSFMKRPAVDVKLCVNFVKVVLPLIAAGSGRPNTAAILNRSSQQVNTVTHTCSCATYRILEKRKIHRKQSSYGAYLWPICGAYSPLLDYLAEFKLLVSSALAPSFGCCRDIEKFVKFKSKSRDLDYVPFWPTLYGISSTYNLFTC